MTYDAIERELRLELTEARTEIERLKAAIAEYNYTSTAKNAEIERLRAEAADRTKKVESLWALSDTRGAEVERLRTAIFGAIVISPYPEEPPRWADCGCAGPHSEQLAAALEPKPEYSPSEERLKSQRKIEPEPKP